MASESKKRKAANSYLDGGAEHQFGIKLKRLFYYCKQDRLRTKREALKASREM